MRLNTYKIKKIIRIICNFVRISVNKIYSILNKITNKCHFYFFTPSNWQREIQKKKVFIMLVITLLIYFFIGIVLNIIWKFNYFYLYFFLFSLILVGAIFAEYKYTKSTDKIRALTNHIEGAQKANSFYSKYNHSIIHALIPILTVLLFGIGGTVLYSTITFTPTVIWCLCFFVLVVHVSIIGYVQYIMLLIYIGKLANNDIPYKNLIKESVHVLPSEISWLKELARVSHFYRNIFFSLGSLYIIAFSGFCFLPNFNVAIEHVFFYILWGVIFIAIALIFPIVSIFEFYLIKKILRKVKSSYVNDLVKENNLFSDAMPEWIKPSLSMIENVFAETINKSESYPIPKRLSLSYAFIISIINLGASIATLLQLAKQVSLFA